MEEISNQEKGGKNMLKKNNEGTSSARSSVVKPNDCRCKWKQKNRRAEQKTQKSTKYTVYNDLMMTKTAP